MAEPSIMGASPDSNPFQGNSLRHSEELAHQLVRHLGVAAARKTCTENQWVGVLAAIDTLDRSS